MKEMRREELEKSIKKALEEGRDWCRIDISHCYQIMINTADGCPMKTIGRCTAVTVSQLSTV